MVNEKVIIARGEVIAIGELNVHKTIEFPYEIPRLSFILIQDSEKTYTSTCIDLHIDGDADSPDEALTRMEDNVYEFLRVNFNEKRSDSQAWEYLKELSDIDDNSKELWNAYSRFKINLAKKGDKTDFVSEIMEIINSLKDEIETLNNLHDLKENEMEIMRSWLDKQKNEIDRLNHDNNKLNEMFTRYIIYQTYKNHNNVNIA